MNANSFQRKVDNRAGNNRRAKPKPRKKDDDSDGESPPSATKTGPWTPLNRPFTQAQQTLRAGTPMSQDARSCVSPVGPMQFVPSGPNPTAINAQQAPQAPLTPGQNPNLTISTAQAGLAQPIPGMPVTPMGQPDAGAYGMPFAPHPAMFHMQQFQPQMGFPMHGFQPPFANPQLANMQPMYGNQVPGVQPPMGNMTQNPQQPTVNQVQNVQAPAGNVPQPYGIQMQGVQQAGGRPMRRDMSPEDRAGSALENVLDMNNNQDGIPRNPQYANSTPLQGRRQSFSPLNQNRSNSLPANIRQNSRSGTVGPSGLSQFSYAADQQNDGSQHGSVHGSPQVTAVDAGSVPTSMAPTSMGNFGATADGQGQQGFTATASAAVQSPRTYSDRVMTPDSDASLPPFPY